MHPPRRCACRWTHINNVFCHEWRRFDVAARIEDPFWCAGVGIDGIEFLIESTDVDMPVSHGCGRLDGSAQFAFPA